MYIDHTKTMFGSRNKNELKRFNDLTYLINSYAWNKKVEVNFENFPEKFTSYRL